MIALVAVLTTLLVVSIAVLVAAAVLAARRNLIRMADAQVEATLKDRLVGTLHMERIVVALRVGETFAGLLVDQDDTTLILRGAVALPSDKAVDGELLIPRADVLYLQKP